MSIYKENRNIVNRLISSIEQVQIDTYLGCTLQTKTYGYRIDNFNIHFKSCNIDTCEIKDKLFIGYKFKVYKIDVNNSISGINFSDMKVEDSILYRSFYKFVEDLVGPNRTEFIEFLYNKGWNNIDKSLDRWRLADNILIDNKFSPKEALSYKPFGTTYNELMELTDLSIYKVHRSPNLLKSIKDEDLIPVAYVDIDSEVYVMGVGSRGRKVTTPINKSFYKLSDRDKLKMNFRYLKNAISIGSLTWNCESRWEYIEIGAHGIDTKRFASYYYWVN